MEVESDSSDSVIISGPIPDYPELRSRKGPGARRNGCLKTGDDDMTNDDKVGKIQELEDLVNATASLPMVENRVDGDPDNWSDSDTKSMRNTAAKYLKKIKTLQQNKRRQETRISRLTKEVRALRDKNSVQAAYIDVLCGMLGEDMKEKFRDRQGLGILGNSKLELEDDEALAPEEGPWAAEDGEITPAPQVANEREIREKERQYYCVEDVDDLHAGRMMGAHSVDDLPEIQMNEMRGKDKYDVLQGDLSHDTPLLPMTNGAVTGGDDKADIQDTEMDEFQRHADEQVEHLATELSESGVKGVNGICSKDLRTDYDSDCQPECSSVGLQLGSRLELHPEYGSDPKSEHPQPNNIEDSQPTCIAVPESEQTSGSKPKYMPNPQLDQMPGPEPDKKEDPQPECEMFPPQENVTTTTTECTPDHQPTVLPESPLVLETSLNPEQVPRSECTSDSDSENYSTFPAVLCRPLIQTFCESQGTTTSQSTHTPNIQTEYMQNGFEQKKESSEEISEQLSPSW